MVLGSPILLRGNYGGIRAGSGRDVRREKNASYKSVFFEEKDVVFSPHDEVLETYRGAGSVRRGQGRMQSFTLRRLYE